MGTESSLLAFPAEMTEHSPLYRVKGIKKKYLLKVRGMGGGVGCIVFISMSSCTATNCQLCSICALWGPQPDLVKPTFWEVKEFPGLAQILRLPSVTIYKALLGNDSDPIAGRSQDGPQWAGNTLISWMQTIMGVDPGRILEGQALAFLLHTADSTADTRDNWNVIKPEKQGKEVIRNKFEKEHHKKRGVRCVNDNGG